MRGIANSEVRQTQRRVVNPLRRRQPKIPPPALETSETGPQRQALAPPSSPAQPVHPSPRDELAQAAREALHTAIQYGQGLEAEYKNDVRPEVRAHLKRTFGVVAFADPLAAGGDVAEMAGQGARARLASELNQAILGECRRRLVVACY